MQLVGGGAGAQTLNHEGEACSFVGEASCLRNSLPVHYASTCLLYSKTSAPGRSLPHQKPLQCQQSPDQHPSRVLVSGHSPGRPGPEGWEGGVSKKGKGQPQMLHLPASLLPWADRTGPSLRHPLALPEALTERPPPRPLSQRLAAPPGLGSPGLLHPLGVCTGHKGGGPAAPPVTANCPRGPYTCPDDESANGAAVTPIWGQVKGQKPVWATQKSQPPSLCLLPAGTMEIRSHPWSYFSPHAPLHMQHGQLHLAMRRRSEALRPWPRGVALAKQGHSCIYSRLLFVL